MEDLRIKIWDNNPEQNGIKQMFQAATSVYGKLRYILGIGQEKGFNTLVDYKPTRDRFIPLLFSGAKDKSGKEIWEGDIVEFKKDPDDEFHYKGVVVYEQENACFSVKFECLGEAVLMPLFGIVSLIECTGKNNYEDKYLQI